MLSLNSITINVNNINLIQNLSLTLLPSAIIYLHGTNGAGKTSLLRVIAGIQSPDSGHISFTRKNIPCSMLKKPYCIYIGHNLAVKSELTVIENIGFWLDAYDSAESLPAALHYFNLQKLVNVKCRKLSAGTQKRVALCRLFARQPKLWLLDEVEANLDSQNKELLNRLIVTKADNGGIVIISTHNPTIKSATIINIYDYKYES